MTEFYNNILIYFQYKNNPLNFAIFVAQTNL